MPTVSNAAVADYRQLQERIGTSRVVIVTPRNYVTDNAVTLDAIRQLGANARGVAVIPPTSRTRSLSVSTTAAYAAYVSRCFSRRASSFRST